MTLGKECPPGVWELRNFKEIRNFLFKIYNYGYTTKYPRMECHPPSPVAGAMANDSGTVAIIITFANLLGGFMLTVGLMTRLVCLLQIPILAGAIIFINAQKGGFAAGSELSLAIVVLLLLIFFLIEEADRCRWMDIFTRTGAGTFRVPICRKKIKGNPKGSPLFLANYSSGHGVRSYPY
jgi:uncharacterized membrane protein YphA (DoxX/SURF4 family)